MLHFLDDKLDKVEELVGKLLRKKNWYKKKKGGMEEISEGKEGEYRVDRGEDKEIDKGKVKERDNERQ